ncbi:MAG: hypothetical protein EOO71_07975 [Myxococcaceae bacterium]|nr:MAG: hypothetical protein EOO71_07975 [Myxococcaceae bacterium]
MGRKSREKRLRRQASPTPAQDLFADIPHDRMGDFLVPRQDTTPDARQAAVERLRQEGSAISSQIITQVSELQTLLMSAPPLEVLAALALEVFAVDREKFRSALSDWPWLFVEYPTWLYLTTLSTEWDLCGVFTRKTVDEVIACEDTLMALLQRKAQADLLLTGQEPSVQDELLTQAREQALFIRQPLHHHQMHEQQLKLFAEASEALHRRVGFGIEDAWDFYLGLGKWVSRRLGEAEERRKMRGKSLRALVDALYGTARDLFTVTPGQLAEVSGHPEDKARDFLRFFSLNPGQAPGKNQLPNLYEPLELAPLVRLGEDRWFVHLLPKLPLAFKPALEKALKAEPRAWNAYEKARGRYLEERSLELVARCSPDSKVWRSLEYDFDEGEGLGMQRFEMDGMIQVDTVLFLVEAKAGSLRWAARRGAPSAMDDLDALVGDAYQQTLRALRFIRSQPRVRFNSYGGDVVELESKRFTRVILLTTTLDDLSAYVLRSRDLIDLGVLEGTPLPWAVAVHDLEVMTDHAEGMGQLVHYIERRQAIGSLSLMVSSESDLFMGYLKNGLRLEGAGNAEVFIPDMSEPIDDYYAHRNGLRRAHALGPRWCLDGPLVQLVQACELAKAPGFIEAICSLLNLSHRQREQFMYEVAARHRSAFKQGFSAFAYIAGETVFAFACGKEVSREILMDYTRATKQVTRRERAVGIMQRVGKHQQVEIVLEFGPCLEGSERQAEAEEVMKRYTV